MVKRIESTHLIVSPDPMMNEVAEEAIRMLADDGMSVKKHQMPVFEDLFPAIPDANSTSLFAKNVELPKSYDLKAFSAIMHSSGMRRKLSCLRHANQDSFRFNRPSKAHSMDGRANRLVGFGAKYVS